MSASESQTTGAREPPPVGGGPWGGFMDVVLSLLPIIVLLVTTLKPNPLPTTVSLPLAAALIWLIRLAYFSADPVDVSSQALSGALSAITPITIVAGAIFLFDSMQSANVIAWMRVQMSRLTNGHHVAEIMLIGWAFAYLIEGASGFGTPAALATPILLSMGHPKFESVCCLLLMNIFATVFGAVGTPVWFGFGSVFANDETALRQIGLYSSIALGVSAACLVPLVVNILVPWRQVRANLIFIELSVLCASGTNLAVATFSYDFPTLLGGVVGMVGTALLVHFRVGLAKADGAGHEHASTVRPTSTRDAAAHAGGDDHIEHHSATPLPLGHQDSASHVHVVDVERLAPRTSSARQPATSRRMSGGSTAASSSQRSRADASSAKATDGNVSGADAASARPTRRDASQRGVVDMGALHEAADEDGERDGPHSPRAASGIAGSGRHPSAGTKHGAGVSSMSEIELASALRAEAARGAHDADDAHDAHDAHEVAERARLLDARLLRETSTSAFLMRTAPIWLTVLLLVLTRIEAIRIKGALRGTTPLFTLQLGTLGGLWLSASLVVGVSSILDVPSSSWSYELLYVPALLPFAVSGSAALLLFRRELVRPPRAIIAGVLGRMRGPSLSLVGAIALVNMMRGTPSDLSAPAYVVGVRVSSVLSHGWVVLCAVLGALGSFFSGSTTVSNLTFGSVQKRAAMLIGVSPTAMCALQACGASFGNAICLNNIIATSTVVGLKVSEGEIMKRTAPIVFGAYVIGTVMMIPFLYGTA